ncbi:hypothetical protein ACQKOF_14845 [Lysinibacillus sp. NPDC093190]|uniref:hypothetical protein n=1 Tax=Lysinibacillus sp. NPDC093190 TaxID=3390575 RepID=UPI003D031B4D
MEIIIEAAKSTLIENLKGQKLAAIRIRGGQPYVYPKEVFLNPVLYGELGLEVPNEVSKVIIVQNHFIFV